MNAVQEKAIADAMPLTQYDLDGGSCISAHVSRTGDMIAILIDPRDAANVSAVLTSAKCDCSDDTEALHKLAALIEAANA